jgi:hypothetical protein
VAFVAQNPNLTVFLVGFLVLCGALARYSVTVSGVVGGAILMTIAAYPYVARRD